MATKKVKALTPAEPNDSKVLRIIGDAGKTEHRVLAEIAADGVATGACLLVGFGKGAFGALSLTEAVGVINDKAKAVHAGNLKGTETMLIAQAVALNAIFGELAQRSGLNMGEHIGAAETYMRLALKAQGQCRATLETLAVIKNPPVVFARQANINNGGQQQVNNSALAEASRAPAYTEPASTHAAKQEPDQTELLGVNDGQGLDIRTPGTASRTDPHLATVGASDRAEVTGR